MTEVTIFYCPEFYNSDTVNSFVKTLISEFIQNNKDKITIPFTQATFGIDTVHGAYVGFIGLANESGRVQQLVDNFEGNRKELYALEQYLCNVVISYAKLAPAVNGG